MSLYYRELGEGPPLIILHGVFGSSDNWFSIGKIFANNWKVFMVDQRNHGRSFHSEEFNYQIMAEDLNKFIVSKTTRKPAVIGHSMGGKVAMHLATNKPNLINKLIVVDVAPKSYPIHHRNVMDGLLSIDIDRLSSREEVEEQLVSYEKNPGVRQFLLKNLSRTKEGNFTWKINLEVISKNLHRLGEALEHNQPFGGKTLFIKGENSDYITEQDEANIREIFPNVTFNTIKNAGHWVQADQPNQFVEAVSGFLSKP